MIVPQLVDCVVASVNAFLFLAFLHFKVKLMPP